MDTVFPKKLALASGILTVTLIIGLIFALASASDSLAHFHKSDIPILEMTSISINLEDRIQRKIEVIANTGDLKHVESYLLEREGYNEHIKDFQDQLKEIKIPFDSKLFSRDEANKIEDQILNDAKAGRKESALKKFNSSDYQDEVQRSREAFQNISEKLATDRDQLLSNKTRTLNMWRVAALATLLLTGVMWYRVISAYNKNVHSKRQAESALEAERVKSINSAKMVTLGEMAGGIAHEINNPLAVIQGYATQLERLSREGRLEPAVLEDRLKKIVSTTMRIAKIIKGLRSFSRDGDKDPLENAQLFSVFTDSAEICQGKFKKLDVELRVKLPDPTIKIECRPVQISQVLVNLLSNGADAVKNNPERWVEIEAHAISTGVEIYVTDSGHGISKEIADKLFQPFFTTKEVGSGTGLGLSISMGIAKSHGAKLSLDRNHKNTRFVFFLPYKQSQKQAA